MASDKTTVLIVEDEPAIVELVTYSLRESGWNCCSVQNVADAWEFIQHRTPHLILLDWMLPDQTGLRLLSRIRADRNFAAIPVIMLTAKSMEEDKLAGLNSGADDYVTKPSRRASCWRAPKRCCDARVRNTRRRPCAPAT